MSISAGAESLTFLFSLAVPIWEALMEEQIENYVDLANEHLAI